MAVSRSFLYMELFPVVPIVCCMSFVRIQYVVCTGLRLCYVQDKVCVMCRLQSVLCVRFSLCYVRAPVCVMWKL